MQPSRVGIPFDTNVLPRKGNKSLSVSHELGEIKYFDGYFKPLQDFSHKISN